MRTGGGAGGGAGPYFSTSAAWASPEIWKWPSGSPACRFEYARRLVRVAGTGEGASARHTMQLGPSVRVRRELAAATMQSWCMMLLQQDVKQGAMAAGTIASRRAILGT